MVPVRGPAHIPLTVHLAEDNLLLGLQDVTGGCWFPFHDAKLLKEVYISVVRQNSLLSVGRLSISGSGGSAINVQIHQRPHFIARMSRKV